MSTDLGIQWNQTAFPADEAENPSVIVEESVKAQRRALIGFKGSGKVDKSLLSLALNPIHAAISLEGEVTLYPRIGDLIEEYFAHGFATALLVTNGLLPEVLIRIGREPSQLYVSVCAPDEETYGSVCRPLISDGWERLNKTLECLNSFSCPTVIRMTLAKEVNLKNPEGYVKLIDKANPTYLEPKAAMAVGYFTRRLPREAMPFHKDIREFAERLAALTSYEIIDEAEPSGVVLLSRSGKSKKLTS